MSYQTTFTCESPRSRTGKCEATEPMANGGCRHNKAESMSRAEFGRLPIVRCHACKHALGRLCPECHRWY
jgi:hypothetical protein